MAEKPDPWEAGRERQRKDVKAIFEQYGSSPPEAVERRAAMPRFVAAPGVLWRKLSRRAHILIVLIIAVTSVVGGFGFAATRRDAQRNEDASRRQDARENRAAIAATIAAQAPRRGHLGPGPTRDALAGAVALQARADVRRGTLSGPIRFVRCGPGANLVGAKGPGAARVLRCLAVTSPAGTPALIGHEYIAVVAVDGNTATWCRRIAPPGHPDTAYALEQALATPVSAPCTRP